MFIFTRLEPCTVPYFAMQSRTGTGRGRQAVAFHVAVRPFHGFPEAYHLWEAHGTCFPAGTGIDSLHMLSVISFFATTPLPHTAT